MAAFSSISWWLKVASTSVVYRQSALSSESTRRISEDFLETYFDALIPLVQENYVDQDRVTFDKILLQTLNEIPRHKNFDRFEITAEDITVENQSLKLNFQPQSKNELVKELARISKFICDVKKYCNKLAENDVVTSMISALDPHSSILSTESFNELKQSTEGMFAGLGVVVGIKNYTLNVTKAIPNSPAERAGIKADDQIIKIDDQIIFGNTLEKIVEKMRGSPNTVATLSVRRKNIKDLINIKINREWIDVASVTSAIKKTKDGSFFIAAIESFSAHTADELLNAYKNAVIKTKIKGFILDLRSNPGGLLDQAVAVTDLFLESGDIVSTDGHFKEVEMSTGMQVVKLPLIVLVNNESASASEIVAGALRDHHRAVIVGQKTFGKGSVQTLFELPFDTALKLTIARYFTPSKHSIQNFGVTPDIALHPLGRGPENTNLYGRNHFVTEATLSHHLVNNQNLHPSSALISFAYLKDEAVDEDLKIAELVLSQFPQKTLMDLDQRSTFSLEQARPALMQYSEESERKVDAWLQEKFKVRWSPQNLVGAPDLTLTAASADHSNLNAGAKVSLNWQLSNASKENASKVSLYLDFDPFEVEPQEVIIGNIGANETKSGTFVFNLPKNTGSSQIKAQLRVAHNFELLENTQVNFNFKILAQPTVSIALEKLNGDSTSTKTHSKKFTLLFSQLGLTSNTTFTFDFVDIYNPARKLLSPQQIVNWNNSLRKVAVEFPVSSESDQHILGLVVKSDSLKDDMYYQIDTRTGSHSLSPTEVLGRNLSH